MFCIWKGEFEDGHRVEEEEEDGKYRVVEQQIRNGKVKMER